MKKLPKLGQKIRYARTEAGLSQKQLAKGLRLSDKAVSTYEVGRAQPSLEVLTKISQLTSRPLAYFIDNNKKEEIDLAYKFRQIEKELAEIRKVLETKGWL